MTDRSLHPRLVSAARGRIRVHVPEWCGATARDIERDFARVDGVHHVRANELTRNVLVYFDPTRTDAQYLLAFACGFARMRAVTRGAEHPVHIDRAAEPPRAQPSRPANPAGQALRWVVDALECAPLRALVALLVGEAAIGWLIGVCQLAQLVHTLFVGPNPLTLVPTGADTLRLAAEVSSLLAA